MAIKLYQHYDVSISKEISSSYTYLGDNFGCLNCWDEIKDYKDLNRRIQ